MYSFVIPTVIAAVVAVERQGRSDRHGHLVDLVIGRMVFRNLGRPLRPGADAADPILWYSVFTFLCAFAQNFEQLFILRAMHGFGFGGEWAAGAVLMGEVIRDKYRGRAVGLVQTGWAVGWGASALVYTALYAFLPEAIAWRALFAVGLLPAIFVVSDPSAYRRTGDLSATQRDQPAFGVGHLFSAFRGRICGPRSRCR